jgi:predicted transcriptional regulator
LETKQKKFINKTTVKELIKSGYKQNDIANKIGVSLATLKRFLKSNNMNKKNNYLID